MVGKGKGDVRAGQERPPALTARTPGTNQPNKKRSNIFKGISVIGGGIRHVGKHTLRLAALGVSVGVIPD